MTDSNVPQKPPASRADSGGFETEMTHELLQRLQDELIEIAAAIRATTAGRVRKNRQSWSAASNPALRRAFIIICLVGAVASAFGALLFFGDAEWAAMSIWIGIGLLFLVFSFLFATMPRWTDALRAAGIRRSLRPAFRAAPYRVRHELDSANGTWTVRSERTGEQTIPVSAEMVAYHGDLAWVLLKPGVTARPVLATAVETADQQTLLKFLQRYSVRVVDARKLGCDDRHE